MASLVASSLRLGVQLLGVAACSDFQAKGVVVEFEQSCSMVWILDDG